MLDLPSNLVAHHLNVLREAGLVSQARSQGDARRSYLRLEPDAFSGLVIAPTLSAPRVVFVCRQNSARSQLAVALWRRKSPVPTASAGTHPASAVHPGAVAVARRHRLSMPRPHTHHLDEVLLPGDLLVAVCDEAHEELSPTRAGGSVLHWSIPDPVARGTLDAFDAAYAQIAARVTRAAAGATKRSRR
jgi:ArsR family transcriptional regulator, arsenate/arsenite/antimonite-responsive transcriptional repressor / arsenate reductase (thioredoxin)